MFMVVNANTLYPFSTADISALEKICSIVEGAHKVHICNSILCTGLHSNCNIIYFTALNEAY